MLKRVIETFKKSPMGVVNRCAYLCLEEFNSDKNTRRICLFGMTLLMICTFIVIK